MDPAYMGGMSPSYVPRKRKTAPPQQRSSVPYPVVQRMPERSFEMSVIGLPRNDEAQALEAQKMKRTYGRKRYEDLQNVTPGPVGVGYPVPDTSCCSVMSSSLANGMEGGFAPPLTRMPPRLVAKDCWPSPGLSSSLSLGPSPGHGPIPGPVPHLDQGRDRGQDQAWRNDFIMKKMPRVEMERSAPAVTSFAPEVRLTVPAPVSSGYVQTNPDAPGFSQNSLVGGSFSQNSLVSGSFSQASPTPSQSSEEPKNKTPIFFSTKKEPPVYPPGSQEERWQLQILDKGRVTCPKCKSVSRKTVEGLKKHMESCRLTPFTCQHCGKQLKSSTGMKYHIMADHSNLPSPGDGIALDDHSVKEKLRKVLKRLGRLKCSKEGCTGSFTSIMGYLYHMKKCGKEESELEKLLLNCSHCGKAYKSKAGLEYHLKSEHAPVPQPVEEEEGLKAQREPNAEWTHSGRVQRQSAQVAVFHLQEIANDELSKDWPKKKFLRDLVPDDRKLKYTRPGLPSFSQEVLRKWKNEVKLQRKVQCPNQGCDCVYTSVSGLKAHLGLCTRGDFEAGKYRCLICNKEFNSESGVKYHINSVHSQDWFVVNKKASIKFEKFLKMKPKYSPDESSNHHHHLHLHHLHHLDLLHHQQQHQHHQDIHQHHHHQHQHQQQHQQQPQQHLQQQLIEQPHHQQFLSHHEHHLQYQHPHIHDQNQPLLQQLQLQPHPPSPSPQSFSTPPWSPGWSVGLNPPTHRGRHRGRWRGRGGSGGEAEGGSLTAERAAAAAEAPAANQRLRRPGDRDIMTNGL